MLLENMQTIDFRMDNEVSFRSRSEVMVRALLTMKPFQVQNFFSQVFAVVVAAAAVFCDYVHVTVLWGQ